MAEQQAEMSLDEVLSSIKQMVIDKDPPVLELTDMISSDGTIVKVKNGLNEGDQSISQDRNDLRDFLRTAQEKGKETEIIKKSLLVPELSNLKKEAKEPVSETDKKACIAVEEIIREVSAPIIKEWLDKNLVNIVKDVVSVEIRKIINQSN